MPSRSTSQLTQVSDAQADDLLYAVRDNGYGVWSDLAIRRQDLVPDIDSVSVTIESADVLTLYDTPVTILPAETGYLLAPIFIVISFSGGTTPYATNTVLRFYSDSATSAEYFASVSIAQTPGITMVGQGAPLGYYQTDDNGALVCSVLTGNPTAGDSDLNITVYYQRIPV